MARLIQEGNTLTYTNSGATDIPGGTVCVSGTFVGVAINDIPVGEAGSIALSGVWEVPKGTATFTQGAKVYWSATSGYATATDTDVFMGYAWAANSSTSAGTIQVKMCSGGGSVGGSGEGSV